MGVGTDTMMAGTNTLMVALRDALPCSLAKQQWTAEAEDRFQPSNLLFFDKVGDMVPIVLEFGKKFSDCLLPPASFVYPINPRTREICHPAHFDPELLSPYRATRLHGFNRFSRPRTSDR
jgi:hypothetical protein